MSLATDYLDRVERRLDRPVNAQKRKQVYDRLAAARKTALEQGYLPVAESQRAAAYARGLDNVTWQGDLVVFLITLYQRWPIYRSVCDGFINEINSQG